MFNFSFKKKENNNQIDTTSSIDKMIEGAYQIIIAPFDGLEIPVKVRYPNEVQLRACGAFSIIDLRNKEQQESSHLPEEQLAELVDRQEAVLKETLVEPTYEEIINKVYEQDSWLQEAKREHEEIEEQIKTIKIPSERQLLFARLRIQKMRIGYLLPNDFTAFIVSWALGMDRSDIRKLTKEILLEAAIMATRGHDNPSDHISGNFTEYHLDQINKTSWILYSEFQENKKLEKTGAEEIRGGKVEVK